MAHNRIFISLIMRTCLFLTFGLAFILLFNLLNYENPMKEAEKWWPFQALFANIATFGILRGFLKKEGLSYNSIIHFKKEKLKKDLVKAFLYLLISFPFAALGLYGLSYLILGEVQPPDNMLQSLPLWAAVIALILFPISNAFVELPTYMGYAFPRIEKKWGSVLLAILITGLFLSIQHGPLPVVFGGSYLVWRLFSFIPLAIVVGIIYSRTRNVFPLIIAHFIMDLQMVILVFMTSL